MLLGTLCGQISSILDNPLWSNDVILIFQDGGHVIANLLLPLVLVKTLMWGGLNLFTDWILMWYLSPWMRYCSFRFLKTNGRHIGILFRVCNPVIQSALGWEILTSEGQFMRKCYTRHCTEMVLLGAAQWHLSNMMLIVIEFHLA